MISNYLRSYRVYKTFKWQANNEDRFYAAGIFLSSLLVNFILEMNNSEQHPWLPSGEWEGYFTYDLYIGRRGEMSVYFDFVDGVVSGSGYDKVGSFEWIGEYNIEKAFCKIVKKYINAHSVFYDGTIDEHGIAGRWRVMPDWAGGFHLWPKHRFNSTKKKELKQDSLSVSALY